MSELLLPKPKILGRFDADCFEDLNLGGYREVRMNKSLGPQNQEFIFQELTRMADAVFDEIEAALAIGRTVKPDERPTFLGGFDFTRDWHVDHKQDVMVSNLPTQFLIGGTQKAIDKILEWDDPVFNPLDSQDTSILASVLKSYSDESLVEEYQFEIWTPEPFQVVKTLESTINRAPKNETDDVLEREFASLILRAA